MGKIITDLHLSDVLELTRQRGIPNSESYVFYLAMKGSKVPQIPDLVRIWVSDLNREVLQAYEGASIQLCCNTPLSELRDIEDQEDFVESQLETLGLKESYESYNHFFRIHEGMDLFDAGYKFFCHMSSLPDSMGLSIDDALMDQSEALLSPLVGEQTSSNAVALAKKYLAYKAEPTDAANV